MKAEFFWLKKESKVEKFNLKILLRRKMFPLVPEKGGLQGG